MKDSSVMALLNGLTASADAIQKMKPDHPQYEGMVNSFRRQVDQLRVMENLFSPECKRISAAAREEFEAVLLTEVHVTA